MIIRALNKSLAAIEYEIPKLKINKLNYIYASLHL